MLLQIFTYYCKIALQQKSAIVSEDTSMHFSRLLLSLPHLPLKYKTIMRPITYSKQSSITFCGAG